jgi:hypothetical protein
VRYLILLDQVGKCFRLTGSDGFGDVAIVRAVYAFSDVKDRAILDALYALRNALAHDHSLFNPSVKVPSRRHVFNLTADHTTPLISFPNRPWSGTYDLNNLPPADEITLVNLLKIGDLGEAVVNRVGQLNQTGGVELRPPLTIDEFRLRYGLGCAHAGP